MGLISEHSRSAPICGQELAQSATEVMSCTFPQPIAPEGTLCVPFLI